MMMSKKYDLSIYNLDDFSLEENIKLKTDHGYEICVADYYNRRDFDVFNVEPHTDLPNRFNEYQKMIESGVPDLIVKSDGEVFFVEVKGLNDAISINQIEWIIKWTTHTNIDIKLAIFRNNNVSDSDAKGVEYYDLYKGLKP
jgi:hypothetical protein